MGWDRDQWIADNPRLRREGAEVPTPEKERAVLQVLAEGGESPIHNSPNTLIQAHVIRSRVSQRGGPFLAHALWLSDFLDDQDGIEVWSSRLFEITPEAAQRLANEWETYEAGD